MTTLREAATIALEVLEDWDSPVALPAMVALKAALAEPVQEPVFEVGFGWLDDATKYPKGTKLYTSPPQRKE